MRQVQPEQIGGSRPDPLRLHPESPPTQSFRMGSHWRGHPWGMTCDAIRSRQRCVFTFHHLSWAGLKFCRECGQKALSG